MTVTLDEIDYDHVEEVLKEYTFDGFVGRDFSLEEQGVEPLDLLGIFFELGINIREYIHGERLNYEGEKLLDYLISEHRFSNRLQAMMDEKNRKNETISIGDLMGHLMPDYLVTIANYSQSLESARAKSL